MPTFLAIEKNWIDQPAANDLVERRTWAGCRMSIDHRCLTQYWDREAQSRSDRIYIPLFPVARWIVMNWWTLFYETAKSDDPQVPPAQLSEYQLAWLKRHSLRAADSGLMLPRLLIYCDGLTAMFRWYPDEIEAYGHMPGVFTEEGSHSVAMDEAMQQVSQFVVDVLDRVQGVSDRRVISLKKNWDAILNADPDEAAFCRATGRMGLDPYDTSDVEKQVIELLEGPLGDDSIPLHVDVLDATDAGSVRASRDWIDAVSQRHNLRGSSLASTLTLGVGETPAKYGYRLARTLRDGADLSPSAPVDDVAALAKVFGAGPLSFEDHNHLPTQSIRAAVGWKNGVTPVLAGPKPARDASLRFLQARGVFQAGFGCDRGPRLITGAFSWDQKASRAFAAELLAPQGALVSRLDGSASEDDIIALAQEFKVSDWVVRRQLQNARVAVAPE